MAGVGLIVARFQRRNPIGYLLLGTALCFVITLDAGGYATLVYAQHRDLPLGAVALVLGPAGILAVFMLPLIVLLFPDGRLPSTRWRPLLVVAFAVAGYVLAANEIAIVAGLVSHRLRVSSDGTPVIAGLMSHTTTLASFATVFVLIVAAVVRQVLAWRHAGTDRRQQIKWLLSGVCVFIVIGVPSLGTSSDLWEAGIAIGFSALPLAIGVGILRYRLYDIDRIVSRTVSYGIVTALLAGAYAGLVLLATRELRFSSEVAVAVSTLAAAAAFNPVRRRVQHLVDRRFNRARYDADLIVAEFAAPAAGRRWISMRYARTWAAPCSRPWSPSICRCGCGRPDHAARTVMDISGHGADGDRARDAGVRGQRGRHRGHGAGPLLDHRAGAAERAGAHRGDRDAGGGPAAAQPDGLAHARRRVLLHHAGPRHRLRDPGLPPAPRCAAPRAGRDRVPARVGDGDGLHRGTAVAVPRRGPALRPLAAGRRAAVRQRHCSGRW